MKTLLQIVQTFCQASGLTVPVSVIGNTDDQITQIVALINEGLDELVVKYKWTELTREASFITVAQETQGDLTVIAPGYKALIPNTLWNRSASLAAYGSINPADVQVLRVWGARTAVPTYRLLGKNLQIIPAPEAGQEMIFEYRTNFPVLEADGITLKQYFTVDTDTCILDANLIVLDLRWRWRMEKGLSFAENLSTFERVCKQSFVDSLQAKSLTMAAPTKDMKPGIVIPPGYWPQ